MHSSWLSGSTNGSVIPLASLSVADTTRDHGQTAKVASPEPSSSPARRTRRGGAGERGRLGERGVDADNALRWGRGSCRLVSIMRPSSDQTCLDGGTEGLGAARREARHVVRRLVGRTIASARSGRLALADGAPTLRAHHKEVRDGSL